MNFYENCILCELTREVVSVHAFSNEKRSIINWLKYLLEQCFYKRASNNDRTLKVSVRRQYSRSEQQQQQQQRQGQHLKAAPTTPNVTVATTIQCYASEIFRRKKSREFLLDPEITHNNKKIRMNQLLLCLVLASSPSLCCLMCVCVGCLTFRVISSQSGNFSFFLFFFFSFCCLFLKSSSSSSSLAFGKWQWHREGKAASPLES